MKLFSWIPSSLATWVYTVLFKPRFLRVALQRGVCLFIPETISIDGIKLALNPKDAVVSGSLALGFYEKSNIQLFSKVFGAQAAGKTFIDVGANIGLYSALAAKYTGSSGKVIAIEPDENNCHYIRKTLTLNGFQNIDIHQMAAGDYDGTANLYLNALNKADHRLYDNSHERASKAISITRIDSLLITTYPGRTIDFVKIDTQGFEYRVLKGMESTFKNNRAIQVVMEFWPWGIIQAGDNPAELLNLIRQYGFKIKRLDEDNAVFHEIPNLDSILNLTQERQHVDLFLER